jgi:putative transposase
MPRAHRHVLDGRTYHVTHRCHDRDFLFKFARDRDAYRSWLRAGLVRERIRCLGYCITSNHVHVLLRAENAGAVSDLMQYVQGCSAQAYNLRKRRQGAFWSDRYHATMIEDGAHFWRCLLYVDLNMVRAGVVGHPREWSWTSWGELMGERRRNRVVDLAAVAELADAADIASFQVNYEQAVADRLRDGVDGREEFWTESVAVGGGEYVEGIRHELIKDYRRRRLDQYEAARGVMALREAASGGYGTENERENSSIGRIPGGDDRVS